MCEPQRSRERWGWRGLQFKAEKCGVPPRVMGGPRGKGPGHLEMSPWGQSGDESGAGSLWACSSERLEGTTQVLGVALPPRKVALGATITVHKCPNLPRGRQALGTHSLLFWEMGVKSRAVSDPSFYCSLGPQASVLILRGAGVSSSEGQAFSCSKLSSDGAGGRRRE